jgi:ADP-L-glycero-D-manno-heptose 6-epimerase
MIVVTGAAGFIGSCFIQKLNNEGFKDIIAVDDFSKPEKIKNLEGKHISQKVNRANFFKWLENSHKFVEFIFHLGARTDTAEFDYSVLEELNLEYSKKIWLSAYKYGLPLVYASSAATYGSGEHGYDDDIELLPKLQPLNPYGISKNEFDKWAVQQECKPYFWVGLKFFNVYGPNEYHKSRMASVILHAYNQYLKNGEVKLFRSHKNGIADGEQKRDFIYVQDIVNVLYYFLHHRQKEISGIYNLGTGKAETFNTLVESIFKAINKKPKISYIDTPLDIRDKYQYFTEAKMERLRAIGYTVPFTSLEEGVKEYVREFLVEGKYF